MLSIYAVLAVILLFGAKIRVRNWDDEFLSLGNTKILQGFCALAIIIHHLSQVLTNSKILSPFKDFGVLFVGIFFFCSGYGIIKSFKTKENYLKGFFGKRLPAVLIPFYLTTLIFMAVFLATSQNVPLSQIILGVTGILLVNGHAWYIVAIVLFYTAFYFIFKHIKNEKLAFWCMLLFIMCYTAVSFLLRHGPWWLQGEWWYNTCLLFFIGMLTARFEHAIIGKIKKYYVVFLPAAIAAFAVMFKISLFTLNKFTYYAQSAVKSGYTESLICFSTQLPAVILFVAAVFILSMKVTFNNVILRFLSKISLELYLIHNLFIILYGSGIIKNDLLYVILVVVTAIASAFVIHLADKALIKLIARKKRLPVKAAEGDGI
ncbi:MAG TPA: acyltransferase [Ruminiclostridium sp.]|nr:acyltransferase [Ruminiclostridium sp.]